MITVHGLANCDTVRRARAWLGERGQPYGFHDFRKDGVPDAALAGWIAALGWERLLNRQGTTWRRLPDDERAAVVDAASARALMLRQPGVIRRPVVVWADGSTGVGFDAADWARRA
ncbi:MAG: ArsC family reductase [Rubrivivax sp.]|nr:ArsC family reductase [Rubrivivax sp.]